MLLAELLDDAFTTGAQTVPDSLLGCWRRNWIRFGPDGALEDGTAVIWLQTPSGMADLRVDRAQRPSETDSSCGITVVDETTKPYVTADWLDGESGFSQQPVSSFPEKGWLSWDSPTIMHELAPSGAYVEQWQRLPDDDGVVAHFVATDTPTTTNLYVAGKHVLLARRRLPSEPLDEYSYGTQPANASSVRIELSTVADLLGSAMTLDHEWALVSCLRR